MSLPEVDNKNNMLITNNIIINFLKNPGLNLDLEFFDLFLRINKIRKINIIKKINLIIFFYHIINALFVYGLNITK